MAEIKVQGGRPDEEQTIEIKNASASEPKDHMPKDHFKKGLSPDESWTEADLKDEPVAEEDLKDLEDAGSGEDLQGFDSAAESAEEEAEAWDAGDEALDQETSDEAEAGDSPEDGKAQGEKADGSKDGEDGQEGQAGQSGQAGEKGATSEKEGAASEKEGGLKGFFKKKKDKKDQQIEELMDRVRRQMAEFDNFRKRTEKEKTAMYEVGAKSVIEKILPVVDNFERGLATAENSEDPFVEGMNKIYKQLMTTLESLDVKPIEAVGQEFNPDLHNAVMHVDDDSVGENIVVEELQKGYMYRDSVVRYSMVKVAN